MFFCLYCIVLNCFFRASKHIGGVIIAKKTYPLRLDEHIKERCKKLGTDLMRDIIEYSTDFKSDKNISILLIRNDIEKITEKRSIALEEISHYEKQVKILKNNIKEYDNIIKSKNESLRELIDMKELEEKEFNKIWYHIQKLINENRFNEIEMQELWETIEYSTKKEVYDNIIIEMKKEGINDIHMSVLKNSL